VRRLAIADEPRDVAHGDRRLLGEELCGRGHPPPEQVLVKAQLAELRVSALDLSRRARKRGGDRGERQRLAVVARDDDAREQILPLACCEGLGLHLSHSDVTREAGRTRPTWMAKRHALGD
jgi:hypothetical protein